ncbi:phosphopantetheine-binding protein [Streptomyces sparsogenes]|uniref:acyl carrier protein n=1 Tax=Streptomyces sparsogenes TaxID=67365 RepID=UPI003333C85C
MSADAEAVATDVLSQTTQQPREVCMRREVLLADLGVDSLALLEMVETLQDRLAIIVPDEVTARIQTVADWQDAASRLAAAAPASEPTTRT